MNGVLLDTDVVIECLRDNKEVIAEVLKLNDAGGTIYYSPVTKCEIFSGMRKGEGEVVKRFFNQLETLPVTDIIGESAGKYQNIYRKSHNLELGDAIIAATANVHQLSLYTFNRKHYPMEDIQLYG